MAKRGAMPTNIARRANNEGWRTAPRRYDRQPGPILPRFVQWVLDHPRYAGLAVYKGEIVGEAQWPRYLSPREHEHLKRRVRAYRSPRLPREPFLLAHLASCGRCGSYMVTLAGKPGKDETRRRTYVCHGHRTHGCDLPQLDALAIDHVLVANLNRFLGGLEEAEPYKPSPGFPRELIRGHDRPEGQPIEPIASVTAELRHRIGHALRLGEHDQAESLIEELVGHHERLRASMARGPLRSRRDLQLNEEPSKLLFDFYDSSANNLAGRLGQNSEDTRRLNRVSDGGSGGCPDPDGARGRDRADHHRRRSEQRARRPDTRVRRPRPLAGRVTNWRSRTSVRRPLGDAELPHALRAWAAANSRAPHISDWVRATPEHPHPNVVIDRFDRWSDAIRAAGLEPAPVERHRHKVGGKYAPVPNGGSALT
ncbi:MAG TPA: recombinase zinc beta ribbon domain-containing protein [Solirubrobacteraceae bacterium]|nr:recombinase zinc beta ribbon domain-containing protein [Solirubrobacteraceae bacterium]